MKSKGQSFVLHLSGLADATSDLTGSDDEPDPYDQISKKVKGQTKKKLSSSAGTPSSSKPKPSQKAADMLKPGKPKTGAPRESRFSARPARAPS